MVRNLLAKKHANITETHVASFSSTTQVCLFNYNHNENIDEFAKYVISNEFPLNHDESKAYEYYTKKNLQPQYRVILRSTLKCRTIELYESKRYDLVEIFKLSNCRVIG